MTELEPSKEGALGLDHPVDVPPMFQSHATSPLLSAASSTTVTADLPLSAASATSEHNHHNHVAAAAGSPPRARPQFTRLESRPPPSALIQVMI